MLKVAAGVKIAHILTNSHFLYSLKEITCFRKQALSCLLQMISHPHAEDQNITTTAMDVDTAFLKSKRGILKLAEMVRHFHINKSLNILHRRCILKQRRRAHIKKGNRYMRQEHERHKACLAYFS